MKQRNKLQRMKTVFAWKEERRGKWISYITRMKWREATPKR